MRVVIIGGGVVGLACAWSLARKGADVVVLEQGEVGAGASQGNTGWVSPTISTPLASPGTLAMGLKSALDPNGALVIRPELDTRWLRWLWSFRAAASRERFLRGVEALHNLNRRTFEVLDAYAADGVPFEMHGGGILVLGKTEKGISWFAPVFEDLRKVGFEGGIEELTLDEARAIEPALSDEIGYVIRTTVDRYVQPQSLMRGLAERLRAQGQQVRERIAVRGLRSTPPGWEVATDSGPVAADRVVVATGAQSPALLRPLGLDVPIVPAKGYSITLRGEGTRPSQALYMTEAKIGVSGFDEGVRIAGVFQLPGRDLTVDDRRLRHVVEQACSYLRDWHPAETEASVEGWAGWRPATPDSLPLLGPVPGHDGLFLATGHGMLGVTLAPSTGELLAEMIVDGARPAWVEPMRPDRRF
ncbi:MAG: NAD(P)/FAD-dependent oxidoreductase [Gaiellales bacterium]